MLHKNTFRLFAAVVLVVSAMFLSCDNSSSGGSAGAVGEWLFTADLSGSADYIDIADSDALDFGTGDFSIVFWAKYGDTGGYTMIIGKQDPAAFASPGFAIFADCNANAYTHGYIQSQVNQNVYVNNSTGLTAGNDTSYWHFYVFVRKSNALYLYVDGALDGSNTSAAAVDVTNDDAMRIGANINDENAQQFNGVIKDIRIYGRALSDDEVAAINSLYQ